MRVSRSISLVIGRVTGRKVQRVIGPRRGSGDGQGVCLST
jgi:hypothetical protein